MRFRIALCAWFCFATFSVPAEAVKDWTQIWGGKTNDYAFGVALDATGNLYVAGSSEGPMAGQDNLGVTQSCVSKVTPEGKVLWSVLWQGEANNELMGVAVDSGGDVYVAGYAFDGFDGLESNGGNDHCLTRWTLSPPFPVLEMRLTGAALRPRFAMVAAPEVDQDVIIFTPHGNAYGTCGIAARDLRDHFDPGLARPL